MLKKLHLKLVLLLTAMVMGAGNVWAGYSELFTIASGDVVSNQSYAAYSATVSSRGYVITFGGNNKSVGTNSNNRSKCNLSNYSKYAVSPVTTSSVASAFANTTSVSGVTKISYTIGGGSNQTNTNVYLLYSSDNTTFSQVSLTSGTQGAAISSGTAYEFNELSGYFALLFVATNSLGNWRIDDVSITFYKDDAPAAPTFSRAAGEFATAFNLTITGATGTTLKYTTDGTEPASSSTVTAVTTNTAVVAISATTRVRAIAIKDGVSSKETDATYTFVKKTDPTFTLAPASLDLKVGGEGTISLATNSDGEVTFSCDNAHVTLSGTKNSRTVSADAEGIYTVNVSVASTDTYMEKAGSVTVNVTKYETTVAIDDSEITNTNLKNGASAGSLSASVTYGDPATDVPAAAVTWTSSNKGVATVNETTGAVTLMGAGNTTITATYAGTAAYDSKTATYNLTVTDTRQSFTWDLSTDSYDATPTEELISWTNARAVMKNVKNDGTKVNNYIPTSRSSTRFYTKNTLTITPSKGYSISSVEFSATTEDYATALANSTWSNAKAVASDKKVVITPTNGANAISATIGATCGFTEVKVYYNCVVTITDAGYATFCIDNALDFSGVTDLTAYTASQNGNNVKFDKVEGTVKAGTGLLVKAAEGTYIVPAVANGTDVSATNALVGVTAVTTIGKTKDGKYNYVLKKGNDGVVGFYQVNNNEYKVRANTAYLAISYDAASSGAKLFIGLDGETAVEAVAAEVLPTGTAYNLQGQRVGNDYKGVVIVNGKKVIR